MVERFLRVQTYCKTLSKSKKNPKASKLFVMTSDLNDEKTRSYFSENNFFGCKEENIVFFKQSSLPTLDFEGKFQLETRTKISMGPNGNGAVFQALKDEPRLLEIIDENHIKYIHVVGVDNVLNKFLDPVFVGLTIKKDLYASAKAIPKTDPHEAIGIFA